jgi:hypothetical protein
VAPKRAAALATVVVAAFGLVGCGPGSEREAGARQAVKDALSPSDYDVGRTHCTDNPRPWFVERDTEVFVCAAKRRDGDCDWYRATLKNAGWEVVLEQPRAGCVLPF